VFAEVVSSIFPAIAAALGGGMAFLLFFVCMIGRLFWVLRVIPETRGVPLEEMERNLGIELTEEDVSGAGSGPRGTELGLTRRGRTSLRRTVDALRVRRRRVGT
jgi:hypothetical protein